MTTALLIVDAQNDFCPGGALGTDRGDEVANKIAELISTPDSRAREYSHVLATQDWHIDPGAHFSVVDASRLAKVATWPPTWSPGLDVEQATSEQLTTARNALASDLPVLLDAGVAVGDDVVLQPLIPVLLLQIWLRHRHFQSNISCADMEAPLRLLQTS